MRSRIFPTKPTASSSETKADPSSEVAAASPLADRDTTAPGAASDNEDEEAGAAKPPGMPGGLSGLSLLCLGKEIDKNQQLSNWKRRPLREDQLRYAALDAHCLIGITDFAASRLQEPSQQQPGAHTLDHTPDVATVNPMRSSALPLLFKSLSLTVDMIAPQAKRQASSTSPSSAAGVSR